MAISLLSTLLYWMLSAAICVIYPGYNTFTHLYPGLLCCDETGGEEGKRNSPGILGHHIFYWAIYYLFFKLEVAVLFYIIPYVPLFYEIKLLMFFWLASDHFKGAGYLFHRYVMAHMLNVGKMLAKEIDEKLDMKNKKSLMDLSKHLGNIEEVKLYGQAD